MTRSRQAAADSPPPSTEAYGVASSARNNATRPSPGSRSPVTSVTWPTVSSSSRPSPRTATCKTGVLRDLDKAIEDPAAVLATNTSSIPVVDLAVVTERPERVIGLHFFNPVPVQQLVEVIPSLVTGADTVRRTRGFAEQLGKQAIQAPDRSGFVVNALLVPYLLSAVRMVESGSARPDDIDRGMELGCAHPMGPLRLLDLIGLDTAQAVAESMYEEYKEPLYAPPALLRRMVAAGHLGRKSGRGFHTYDS
ncbi:3-hydroxyacyl-CoA dehydrogenase [Streptomyces sp. SAI-144]|nr:3-hydroxyacyl-CoA dehydrogenase [Streptomyces sp. SAI-144]